MHGEGLSATTRQSRFQGLSRSAATGVGGVLNVALNFWLIPRAGPVGAAQATLMAYGVAAWLSSWFHPAVRANARMQSRALLIPFRAWRYLRSS